MARLYSVKNDAQVSRQTNLCPRGEFWRACVDPPEFEAHRVWIHVDDLKQEKQITLQLSFQESVKLLRDLLTDPKAADIRNAASALIESHLPTGA